MAEEEWPAWQSKKADWMLWYMINDRHQTYVDCACAWETDNVTDAIAKDRLEKVVAKRERESKTWVPDREAWMDRAAEIYQRERRLRKSGYIWARSLGGTSAAQMRRKELDSLPAGKSTQTRREKNLLAKPYEGAPGQGRGAPKSIVVPESMQRHQELLRQQQQQPQHGPTDTAEPRPVERKPKKTVRMNENVLKVRTHVYGVDDGIGGVGGGKTTAKVDASADAKADANADKKITTKVKTSTKKLLPEASDRPDRKAAIEKMRQDEKLKARWIKSRKKAPGDAYGCVATEDRTEMDDLADLLAEKALLAENMWHPPVDNGFGKKYAAKPPPSRAHNPSPPPKPLSSDEPPPPPPQSTSKEKPRVSSGLSDPRASTQSLFLNSSRSSSRQSSESLSLPPPPGRSPKSSGERTRLGGSRRGHKS